MRWNPGVGSMELRDQMASRGSTVGWAVEGRVRRPVDVAEYGSERAGRRGIRAEGRGLVPRLSAARLRAR